MIKLNLAQNAYHTLHHAIEHLALTRWSGDFDSEKRFDHDAHMIEWTESGSLCFYIQEGYVRPPRTYNLKFALLLLVQACELFLKAHIEQIDKSYLFVRVGSRKTISLNMALQLVIKWETHFLTPDEVALLLRAKDIRSDLEHFELTYPSEKLYEICIDFLMICALFSQSLFKSNLVQQLHLIYGDRTKTPLEIILPLVCLISLLPAELQRRKLLSCGPGSGRPSGCFFVKAAVRAGQWYRNNAA